MNGVEWGLTMLMTMIKLFVLIPYLLLGGCSGLINIYLDNKFPVNMNNDGNKITVYSTISPETVVQVRGTYTSNKCQRSHFNADYTEVSYSSLTQKVEVERKIAEDNKNATYTVPIDGGGWCNWKLIKIELAPISTIYKNHMVISKVIPIVDNKHSKIELFTTLAPVIVEEDDQSIYYIIHHQSRKVRKNYPINQMEKSILIIKLNLNLPRLSQKMKKLFFLMGVLKSRPFLFILEGLVLMK